MLRGKRRHLTRPQVEIVALKYLETDCKKTAMMAVFDDAEYCNSSAAYKMFKTVRVQEAIARLETEAVKLTGDLTLEDVVQGFRDMAFPKTGVKVSHADQNYALDKLAKIKGGYVDKLEIGRMDAPIPITPEDATLYREMARAATRDKLASHTD